MNSINMSSETYLRAVVPIGALFAGEGSAVVMPMFPWLCLHVSKQICKKQVFIQPAAFSAHRIALLCRYPVARECSLPVSECLFHSGQ